MTKPLQPSAATVVTTAQQRRLIETLEHDHLEEGGCILAQVFFDGLRVRVLTPAQTRALVPAIADAFGKPASTRVVSSVFFDQTKDRP